MRPVPGCLRNASSVHTAMQAGRAQCRQLTEMKYANKVSEQVPSGASSQTPPSYEVTVRQDSSSGTRHCAQQASTQARHPMQRTAST